MSYDPCHGINKTGLNYNESINTVVNPEFLLVGEPLTVTKINPNLFFHQSLKHFSTIQKS